MWVCQQAFSLLKIGFQIPSGFESCIQQRKKSCLLSIRKSLACARASKLTATNMYVCMYVCMHACMYVCMFVCIYVWVCMRVNRHLNIIQTIYFGSISFVKHVVPETRSHHSQQFGSVYPETVLSVCALLCFNLVCVAGSFFNNILKDYFFVSVYSHECPNDWRQVMMNFSK